MMVVVPADTPVTIPVVAPIVAIGKLVLIHVPPGVRSVSVIVVPGHKADGPAIVAGNGFTLITALPDMVRVQPVAELVANTV
jgi:hypothetical protein